MDQIIYIQGDSNKLYQSFTRLKTYLESFESGLFMHSIEEIKTLVQLFVTFDYEFEHGGNGSMIHKVFVTNTREELNNHPDYINLTIYNTKYTGTYGVLEG